MADVTAPRTEAHPTDGTSPAKGRAASRDSRAVRVRLAAASRGADDVTLVVDPIPHVVDAPASAVLTQRHGLVVGEAHPAVLRSRDATRHSLVMDGETTDVVVERPRLGARGVLVREVLVDGFRFEVETEPDRLASLRERATRDRAGWSSAGPTEVRAVIPGRVLSVAVTPGDEIIAGSQLLVIEAMKMQNELRAPRDGTIARVGASVGATVEIGDLLVVIE